MSKTFAQLTTMRVGGPIGRLDVASTPDEAVALVRAADGAGEPLLVIGGGSNIVVGDDGWPGRVVRMASDDFDIAGDLVRAAAGVDWDRLVRATVDAGLAGLEALSGIPGSAGGTPVQNVGAYGALTSDVLESVTVYDRTTGEVAEWGPQRCGFGRHRQSVFKRADRWVILAVAFRLTRGRDSGPVAYEGLARQLGLRAGGSAPVADVREAVLALRRSKGMVLDPADHDTWSVGSFFLNPVLPEVPAAVPAECPRWPDPDGVKLPAGWLIQHAGFPPGYTVGNVGLSGRHALAVTNRGGATAADVVKFAAHVRAGVEAAFGVRLAPECDLINCSL